MRLDPLVDRVIGCLGDVPQIYRTRSLWAKEARIANLGLKLVRLAPNWTNPGLFKITFQLILARQNALN